MALPSAADIGPTRLADVPDGVESALVVFADEFGWAPVEDAVHINDFHATLLHLFGLDHLKLSRQFGGLNLRLTNLGGKVVRKLLA